MRYRWRSATLTRRPSTRTSSCTGSALVPSSRTMAPLTLTRPSRINCSLARRDATPARERIFCSRSWLSRSFAPSTRPLVSFVPCPLWSFVFFVSMVSGSLRQRGPPQPGEPQGLADAQRATHVRVRDQVGDEQPHRRMPPYLVREVFGLDSGDHVIVDAVQEKDRGRRLRRSRRR